MDKLISQKNLLPSSLEEDYIQKRSLKKRSRGRPIKVIDANVMSNQLELDLFELANQLDMDNPKPSYMATAMMYACLPHKKLDTCVFKRSNGQYSLSIMNDPDIGLPFGKIPRIILAFLCTEAKKTGSPLIQLGNKTEFAAKLGMACTGGKNGTLNQIETQAKRLFTSHITLTRSNSHEFAWKNVNLTDSGIILWDDKRSKTIWESKLQLTDAFFQECMDHPIPIYLEVIKKFRSPLTIDIYIWLTYRFNILNKPLYLPWEVLKEQFGASYSDISNFVTYFKKSLKQIKIIYKEANFQVSSKNLILFPSKPHISRNKL